jgi:hypothetical protein
MTRLTVGEPDPRDNYPAPSVTPWGPPCHTTDHGLGIRFCSCEGHGGFYVPRHRWSELAALWGDLLPSLHLYSPPGWFEEDCDWCLVFLTWPDITSDTQLLGAYMQAKQTAESRIKHSAIEGGAWATVCSRFEGLPAYQRVVRETELRRPQWRATSRGYDHRGWRVYLLKDSTGEHRTAIFAEYPAEPYYTDEEVAALDIEETT